MTERRQRLRDALQGGDPPVPRARGPRYATVRRELTRLVEDRMRELGVDSVYHLSFDPPVCAHVNPLCPSDFCYLPAGHFGAEYGWHVLGTCAYDDPIRLDRAWNRPTGTPREALVEEGWAIQREMFPEDFPCTEV